MNYKNQGIYDSDAKFFEVMIKSWGKNFILNDNINDNIFMI